MWTSSNWFGFNPETVEKDLRSLVEGTKKLDSVNIVHHDDDGSEFARVYVNANKGDYTPGGPSEKQEKANVKFHDDFDVGHVKSGFAGSGKTLYTHKKTGEKYLVTRTPNGKTFYGTDHRIEKLSEDLDENHDVAAFTKDYNDRNKSDDFWNKYNSKAVRNGSTAVSDTTAYADKKTGKMFHVSRNVVKKVDDGRMEESTSLDITEGVTFHNVDWDGPSRVMIVKHTPSIITVRRVDKNDKPLQGYEHEMIYSKHDPEYKQINREREASRDHEAWQEKNKSARSGRHYHESVNEVVVAKPGHNARVMARNLDIVRKAIPAPKPIQIKHQDYTIVSSNKPRKGDKEQEPFRIDARADKLDALDVRVHDKNDYGPTKHITTKHADGSVEHHHIYQTGAPRNGLIPMSVRALNDSEGKHTPDLIKYLTTK